ncbi:MAG: T9SS type A sorting domain-containing protein [Chitinophagaceae bacterium]|nr:MAG: T9SS type A sorting domain-containing protein [Chitinophagaceae bacterium]
MRRVVCFLLALGLAVSLKAQNWKWSARADDRYVSAVSGHNSQYLQVAGDADGGVVLAQGLRLANGGNSTPVVRIARYDRTGRLTWDHYLEQPPVFSYSEPEVWDVKIDRWGQVYLLAINYTRFDNGAITPTSGKYCLYKFSAQGRLIWKRPGGNFTVKAQLGLSTSGLSVYMFTDCPPGFTVLDSTFSNTVNGLFLGRLDTGGVLRKSMIIQNGRTGSGTRCFSVNAAGEVLISGTGSNSVTVGDTTITLTSGQVTRNFVAKFEGTNFSRKWVRVQSFQGDFTSADFTDHAFLPNGNIVQLLRLSRSGSASPLVSASFEDVAVQLSLVQDGGSPFLVLFDSSGRFLRHSPFSTDAPAGISKNNLAVDTAGRIYFGSDRQLRRAGGSGYWGGTLYAADSTGAPLWSKNIQTTDSVSGSDFSIKVVMAQNELRAGMVLANGFTPVKYALGPDTLAFPNCPFCGYAAISAFGDRGNYIRGRVFRDENGNGQFDAADRAMVNQEVRAGSFRAFTDPEGYYRMDVDSGTYSVTAPGRRFYRVLPATQTAAFTAGAQSIVGKNFSFVPDTSVTDVSIELTQFGLTRPGLPSYVQFTVRNLGILPASGTYGLKLDPLIRFDQSDSTRIFTSPDSVAWAYSNLQPEATIRSGAVLLPDAAAPMGTLIRMAASVTPYASDTIKANNRDTAWVRILSSYDPNDKQVSPFHVLRIDSAQGGKYDLEYTIRFQNTGNDTAFLVHLADTLSELLDFNSIRLLAWSHPVQLEWRGPNQLHFWFNNILLPGSQANERASHGFVRFAIRPKSSVIVSDSIRNRAGIYFDRNEVVLTNRTNTYFGSSIVTALSSLNYSYYKLAAFPNPARKSVHYRITGGRRGNVYLRLMNLSGVVVWKKVHTGGGPAEGDLNIEDLPAGVYALQAIGPEGTGMMMIEKK